MDPTEYYIPSTLMEALEVLRDIEGTLLAGGTDLIPQMRDRTWHLPGVIDLSRLSELRYISQVNGRIHIGSLTTFKDILDSALLRREARSLVEASAEVGSPQIRNQGTVGGNIGNASPAGDLLPPLLTLDADVHLRSLQGERIVRLAELLLGPGRTAIGEDELIHHIRFEQLSQDTFNSFRRLGNREGMAVSIASCAVAIKRNDGSQVEDIRVALGAVAPTAIRCPDVEHSMRGKPLTIKSIETAARTASQECSPIDDIRGTAEYRRHVAFHLVRRSLTAVMEVA
jgi:CO/xanthine dehydrogenase FAD-binding subunit